MPVCDILARELRIKHGMLAVSTGWAGAGEPAGLVPPEEDLYGIHGGDVETSIMLHLRPDLGEDGQGRGFSLAATRPPEGIQAPALPHGAGPHWPAGAGFEPSGAVGNAARATAERGRLIVDHQARAFVELLEEVARFDRSRLYGIAT